MTAELTDRFLDEVLLTLRLERALILTSDQDGWKPTSTHEIDLEDFWNQAPLSLTVLNETVETGKSVLFMDAAGADQPASTSIILTGLRSVVCVPVFDRSQQVVALIYADNRIEKGAFSSSDLETLEELAKELSSRLCSR